MAREIVINNKTRASIRKIFGCSHPTIRRALRGAEDTFLCIKIREAAKKMGGKYTVDINEEEARR
jgi:hypothetical protein